MDGRATTVIAFHYDRFHYDRFYYDLFHYDRFRYNRLPLQLPSQVLQLCELARTHSAPDCLPDCLQHMSVISVIRHVSKISRMSLQINGHQTLAKTRLHESCAVVFESHVVGLLRWNVRAWIVRVMFAPNVFFQATFFVVVSFHTRILLSEMSQQN